jgi:predicted RNase H-like HicB family nuclease
MKLRAIIHQADEGGYWAEVPAIPGCLTEGDTMEELLANIQDAAEACLSVEVDSSSLSKSDQVIEIAV